MQQDINHGDPLNNIEGISSEKLTVLRNLSKKLQNLPPELAIPYIAQANSQMHARNMSFTDTEINYLLDTLTKDMSPPQKQRIDILRGMINR